MLRSIGAAALFVATPFAALLFAGSPACAQDYPNKAITLIVPFAAGGGVDTSARLQALAMGQLLGQSIIVENVGGAGGVTGSARVANAAPDGYTFIMGNSGTHAYSQSIYKKPVFNAVADFTPVGLVTESPRVLVVRNDLPVKNLQELVAWLKANEKKSQFGSAGTGAGTHLPCVLFNSAIGVDITHVPYRGEGPAMQDVIAGRLDYMCATVQSGAAQANAGAVRAVAVMAHRRVAILPNVPTTGEQGVKDIEASVWNAFFLPKGAPPAVVAKLNKAMSDAVDEPLLRTRLEELGLEIAPPDQRSPQYLGKFLQEEIDRWGKVVRAAGIVVE